MLESPIWRALMLAVSVLAVMSYDSRRQRPLRLLAALFVVVNTVRLVCLYV
jgi:hypothetical protein